jgi:ubiquinone/menaquinone biosynthesis C-methylase UbiE
LLERGFQTTGSDVSQQMLDVARPKLATFDNLVDLVVGDAEALPFADRQFDGVVCMRLYQRVPAEARVRMLQEVKRIGRGWAVLFFAMSTPWLDTRRAIRSRVLSRHPTISHPISFKELHAELQIAGLTMVRSTWTLPRLSDGIVILVTW